MTEDPVLAMFEMSYAALHAAAPTEDNALPLPRQSVPCYCEGSLMKSDENIDFVIPTKMTVGGFALWTAPTGGRILRQRAVPAQALNGGDTYRVVAGNLSVRVR